MQLTNDIVKVVINYNKILELASINYGYPPPNIFSIDFSRTMVLLISSRNKKKIDEAFQYIYNNDCILKILDNWTKSDLITRRIEILEQAINNHLLGNYYASIPILLAQTEGIIADCNIKGTASLGYKATGVLTGDDDEILRERLKNLLSDSTKMYDYYNKTILDGFGHNIDNEKRCRYKNIIFFSRHAILHGGDTEYGTLNNSIRAILLFDYIFNKCEQHNNMKEVNK